MEIETKSCKSWSNDDIKCHGGFLERAKASTHPEEGVVAKIKEFGFEPNRVIITGHSLGKCILYHSIIKFLVFSSYLKKLNTMQGRYKILQKLGGQDLKFFKCIVKYITVLAPRLVALD